MCDHGYNLLKLAFTGDDRKIATDFNVSSPKSRRDKKHEEAVELYTQCSVCFADFLVLLLSNHHKLYP